jgi:hypothetical protein
MAEFVYYNVNPLKIEEEDCVCRAITLASELPYYTVCKLLELSAEHNDCEKLCVNCYEHLLTEVLGYTIKLPKYSATIEEIVNRYPNNTLILRINYHLTCAINGTIYDLWDCRDMLVDMFWIVK